MKFAIIALIATVAAETKTLSLGGAAPPSPADAKDNKNITTEKWEMTKDGVTTKYEAQFDKENKSMKSQMRKTWEDYFMYAFKQKNMADDGTQPSCATAQECNTNGHKSMCCVNTVLHHKASGTKDINYRCMTKAVIDANVEMKLGDFEVHMDCVGSGAKHLTLGA